MNRLAQRFELLYLLVLKDLKVRYKSRFFGYLWALANPFAFAFVYWIAFKFIMRVDVDNYSLYLITGMFPWFWLSAAVVQGTRSYMVNRSLVMKVALPRALLPLSNAVQEMAHFAFSLPIIIGFLMLAGGYPINPSWLWQIPLLTALQVAFIYPLALSFALLNVYVRDIEYLVNVAFSLLFFATPIVYPITMVPEDYRIYFELNPLHALTDSWRSIFLQGTVNAGHVAYVAAVAAVGGVVAWILYRRMAHRIAELL